ncbi:hypothetical protein ANANG_G00273440 [Anguilla anguilla]|uniref:Uncharacterized protein n=1 Tax=Anguilla anguilla TaxID=7936 RepID=A0A9D3LMF6_ANGAN|nr:hypothetical protein ANANG_G00273440 [Anguilla anguilla]
MPKLTPALRESRRQRRGLQPRGGPAAGPDPAAPAPSSARARPHPHAHQHPHQPGNHVLSQPIRPLQPSAQPLQYSTASYPSQLLPVSPNQQYTVQDNLGAQFSHMNLVRQASAEGPDGHTALYSSSMVLQAPQQAGYMVAPPGQPGPAPPTPAPPSVSQPIMQQQGYIQQPMQQMPACYCAPGQYPHSSQQYRPVTPVHYNSPQNQPLPQPAQQSGYQTVMPNQPQSYQSLVGLPQPQSQSLLGSQHASMGAQMQGMMVQYPTVPSYQVSMAQGSQGMPQQTYQQPMLIPSQSSQGPVPASSVYRCTSRVIPPGQQSTMSSSVSFLPPPGSEQMQFPRTSSPCSSQQLPGQQCAAFTPNPHLSRLHNMSVPPPHGSGMLMMQLTLPPNQQPRAHSPQWKHHKYYSLDHQRGQKCTDLPSLDTSQSSPQLGSPSSSRPSRSSRDKVTHGTPCWGSPSSTPLPSVPPSSMDLTLSPTTRVLWEFDSGRILEVTDLPEGMGRVEADSLLGELCKAGATIRWLPEPRRRRPRRRRRRD